MCAEEEVAQVDEFAVSLVLNIDNTPAVLAAANLLAIDNDGLLRANNGERDKALLKLVQVRTALLLLMQRTLIWPFRARSSSSNSSLSYGNIFRLWKANSSLMRSLNS